MMILKRFSAYVPGTDRNISDLVIYNPNGSSNESVLRYCFPPNVKIEIPEIRNKTYKQLCMPVNSKKDLSEAMSLAENSMKGSGSTDIKAFSEYFKRLKSEQPPVKRPVGLKSEDSSNNFVDLGESEIEQYLKDLGFHRI